MAYFPCDWDNKRFRGAASHAYPALVYRSGLTNRWHLRLCPDHMGELEEAADLWMVAQGDVELEDRPPQVRCMECGHDVDANAKRFFMTTYPKSADRADFYGLMHDDCQPPTWLQHLTARPQQPPATGGRPVQPQRT